MQTVDSYLTFFAMIFEFLILIQIFRGGIYRQFPVFSLFIAESLLSAIIMLTLYKYSSPNFYYKSYIVDFTITSILVFSVLVELIWSVLKPFHALMPRFSWIIPIVLVLLAGALIWPIAGLSAPSHMSWLGYLLYRFQSTAAIVRILIFVVFVAFSRILAIGWKSRELQIITGLGLYSIVYLSVEAIHTHQTVGGAHFDNNYHLLDQLVVISYLASLLYWLLMFGLKELPRKNFTPPMAEFVLRLSNKSPIVDSVVTNSSIHDRTEPERK